MTIWLEHVSKLLLCVQYLLTRDNCNHHEFFYFIIFIFSSSSLHSFWITESDIHLIITNRNYNKKKQIWLHWLAAIASSPAFNDAWSVSEQIHLFASGYQLNWSYCIILFSKKKPTTCSANQIAALAVLWMPSRILPKHNNNSHIYLVLESTDMLSLIVPM